jgi:peptide-methionine (S)-S-oxide reductase
MYYLYLFKVLNKKFIIKIYLAGGCFWCTEAVFQRVKGVHKVLPGYIDGSIKNPSYREVCTGRTGHTEAIEVSYDPEIIHLSELLMIFFTTHDPTTLNRQGNDVGTQYRSGIYYSDVKQKEIALSIIKQLEKEHLFHDPIVTEVKEASPFYLAEEHNNYYNKNKEQAYCSFIISPKIEKLKAYFKEYIAIENE